MATLKAKNNVGEWETVADVSAVEVTNQLVGDLKSATIRLNSNHVYDLSPYVGPESNFLFFFKSTTNSSSVFAGGELYVLDKIEETARKAYWEDTLTNMGWFNSANHLNTKVLFPDGWKFEGTWDNEACTLSFPESGAHDYGLLLYCDIKEA